MNHEWQPWIADFASLLHSIVFLFSRFWRSGFSYRFVCDVFCILGSGFAVFLLVSSCPPPSSVAGLVWVTGPLYCGTGHVFFSFGPGLGWFLRISSCLHPPLSVPGFWVMGPLNCGTGQSVLCVHFFSVLPTPPRSEPGAIWGILATLIVAQDCMSSCVLFFWRENFVPPPSLGLCRYFGFSRFL